MASERPKTGPVPVFSSSQKTETGTGPVLAGGARSEEHTSELQSLAYLVCRLLLEKKKNPSAARIGCRAARTTRAPLATSRDPRCAQPVRPRSAPCFPGSYGEHPGRRTALPASASA